MFLFMSSFDAIQPVSNFGLGLKNTSIFGQFYGPHRKLSTACSPAYFITYTVSILMGDKAIVQKTFHKVTAGLQG